ncbi:MAG: hypothetical protein JST92_17440 [Deltaproteobacteria bacterium]|nr:hypothetical protein [Deltaproteobacteria bacterium]
MPRRPFTLSLCALTLLLAAPALATILQARVDVESLTRGADAVVRARVVRQVSHYGAGGPQGGLVFTTTQLTPLEWWKGAPEAGDVLVRAPGGSIGAWAQDVQGVARFEIGDEVVLFLKKRASAGDRAKARTRQAASGLDALPDLSVYEVHQWTMGKFDVRALPEASGFRATRDRHTLTCRNCGGEADDALSLDTLKARVLAAAREATR